MKENINRKHISTIFLNCFSVSILSLLYISKSIKLQFSRYVMSKIEISFQDKMSAMKRLIVVFKYRGDSFILENYKSLRQIR